MGEGCFHSLCKEAGGDKSGGETPCEGKKMLMKTGIGFGMMMGHVGLQVKKGPESRQKEEGKEKQKQGRGSNRGCSCAIRAEVWSSGYVYCVYMVTSAWIHTEIGQKHEVSCD